MILSKHESAFFFFFFSSMLLCCVLAGHSLGRTLVVMLYLSHTNLFIIDVGTLDKWNSPVPSPVCMLHFSIRRPPLTLGLQTNSSSSNSAP